MKKLTKIFIFLFSLSLVWSCQREEIKQEAASSQNSALKATWEDVITSSSFSSRSALEASWNYLYPWGATHNGSAKMIASSTVNTYLWLESGNVLAIKAVPVSGQGSIHYYSGAIHAKKQVLVNDQYPNWEVKCDFQCPSARGTWPAFWLNGAWTWPPESDIMEFKGNNQCWQNTFRTSSDVSTTISSVSSPGSWHTYRAWITKVSSTNVDIHYYIDGVWKAKHTANFVGKPMNLIINLQMEGSSGTPGPTGTTYYRAKNIYVGRTKAY